jgi:hypothetical protein
MAWPVSAPRIAPCLPNSPSISSKPLSMSLGYVPARKARNLPYLFPLLLNFLCTKRPRQEIGPGDFSLFKISFQSHIFRSRQLIVALLFARWHERHLPIDSDDYFLGRSKIFLLPK